MRPIVSFDVDNTLLDHSDWRIPDSAIRALEELRKTHYIVLASGRDMDNRYSRDIRDLIKPDGIIHMNGTKITVGDRLIYEHRFDRELLCRILTFTENMGYSVGVSVDDVDYYMHPECVEQMDIRRWGRSDRTFLDPWKLMELNVRTLAYIGTEDGALDIEAHFPEVKLLMFAGRQGADLVEKEASKAKGLIRLCEWFGTDIRDTVAFGDSMNDLEILREAGLGIAMGNSIEELKAAADYVTDDISRDGIWNACRHFRLI